MKLILLPVLLSLAYIGFEHKAEISDQYHAAYPIDPVKRAMIEECARAKNFNRLDAIDRDNCYAGHIGSAPIALAASPSPGYAYSPSHLPSGDVRRQEANESYMGGFIGSASAAPFAPASVLPASRAPAHAVPVPQRVVTRTVLAGAGQTPPVYHPARHTESQPAYRQRVAAVGQSR